MRDIREIKKFAISRGYDKVKKHLIKNKQYNHEDE